MSPFSIFLRQVREGRGLRQKDVAELLGYEQSYLSAVENGLKGIPRDEFIQQFTKKLQLSEDEVAAMRIALADSRRTLNIPVSAKVAEFRLAHQFERVLGNLSEKQIQFLELALELSAAEMNGSMVKSDLLKEGKM
jgi:transcriptional regulator with XRE-family HTH domain